MEEQGARGGLEEALQKSESRYQEIYRNAPVGIFHTTQDGKILDANPYFARCIGYDTPDELIAAVNQGTIAALYGDPSRREYVSRQAFRSADWQHFEGRYRRRDGTFGVGRMTLRSCVASGAPTRQIEGFMEDVTDQSRLQERLIRAQRLESLAQLAAGIAHQFNNINTVVTGFLEIAVSDPSLPENLRMHLESALEGALRGVEITSRLDILSRSPSLPTRILSLEKVLPPLMERYAGQARDNGVELRIDLADPSPAYVDLASVEFILDSLLSNAFHALLQRSTRTITVRARSAPGRSFLQVSDTGSGIRKEDLPKVFTPFFSTKGEWASAGSPQANVRGMGMSLAVCRSLVNGCGGSVEVESEEKSGSTFTVWLPRDER